MRKRCLALEVFADELAVELCADDLMSYSVNCIWETWKHGSCIWSPTSDIASTADLQEIICSGFDLSCCCVSLTVDEMLHVNLRYHCDADIHLPKMQTTLLPCAFGAPSNCIHIQLERIFKYYKRGFRFEEEWWCVPFEPSGAAQHFAAWNVSPARRQKHFNDWLSKLYRCFAGGFETKLSTLLVCLLVIFLKQRCHGSTFLNLWV